MKNLSSRTWVILAFTMMVAAACSGAPTPTQAVRSTVTPIPVYQYVAPTAVPQIATSAASVATEAVEANALNPQSVERGRDRYVALACASCHGENGEGTDDGAALTALTLTENEFISFMRSGGSLGSAHQYAANRLSDTGGRNLYQYLLSLNSDQ